MEYLSRAHPRYEHVARHARSILGRVSNVYLDDRYNRTHLRRTYKLPEVGGDFRR